MSRPTGHLGEASDVLWEVLGRESDLVADLPDDAAIARARRGELAAMLPRLLDLTVTDSLERVPATEVFDLLAADDWQRWDPAERDAVVRFLEVWWETVRTDEQPELSVGHVLALLARTGLPLVRWLRPWLDDLDGPAARHLADEIVSQLDQEAWQGWEDARRQILAWTRSEPVIIGLTVVGGVHLSEGRLGEALDHML